MVGALGLVDAIGQAAFQDADSLSTGFPLSSRRLSSSLASGGGGPE